jgi:SAM-dependent methyltransferase
MPSVLENLEAWTARNWADRGERWSSCWGGSENIWFGTLLPRLHDHLPARRMLEIAPGFGRMTQHLLRWCTDDFIGIDLTRRCAEYCQFRFSQQPQARFFVNDGTSLEIIEDGSLDFVFSWDSLVHAECDVLESYLRQLGRKLRPGGAGFFHHSNLGAYRTAGGELSVPNPHWRGTTMTAELFRTYCTAAGLRCVTQVVISWELEPVLNDCFSYFVRDKEPNDSATTIVERPDFFETEVARLHHLRSIYTRRVASEPVEMPLDWRLDAKTLQNFSVPFERETVATATLAGKTVRVLDTEDGTDPVLLARTDPPGTILKSTPRAIVVQTGRGTLVVRRLGYLGAVHQASELVHTLGAARFE